MDDGKPQPENLQRSIERYVQLVPSGELPQAYRGILSFMSALKGYLEKQHPEYASGALYLGYMDMTCFSFTPERLKSLNLKMAIVFLHDTMRFAIWLGGANRGVRDIWIKRLSGVDTAPYVLSEPIPGVDSIMEATLVEKPDFNDPKTLMRRIESASLRCIDDMTEHFCREGLFSQERI